MKPIHKYESCRPKPSQALPFAGCNARNSEFHGESCFCTDDCTLRRMHSCGQARVQVLDSLPIPNCVVETLNGTAAKPKRVRASK